MATTNSGMVGNSRCVARMTREITVPSPMPASKMRTAGGVGRSSVTSCVARCAIADFSLQVLTNARYFWRLS